MKTSFFLCPPSLANSSGERFIQCRYSHQAGTRETPYKFTVRFETNGFKGMAIWVHPDDWIKNAKKLQELTQKRRAKTIDRVQRVIHSHKRANIINSRLNALEKQIDDICTKLLNKSLEPIPRRIQKEMTKDPATIYIVGALDKYLQEKKVHSIIPAYKRLKKDLIEFQGDGKRLTFIDMDERFLRDFCDFLRSKGNIESTISGKIMERLKPMLRYAYKENWTSNKDWMNWVIKKPQAKTVAFMIDELKLVMGADLQGEMDRIRDLIVFLCWSGLRISEYSQFLPGSEVQPGALQYRQMKKGDTVVIRVHYLNPVTGKIWQKYKGELPMYNTSDANYLLKKLGKKLGLNRICTTTKGERPLWRVMATHMGRRTLATLLDRYGKNSLSTQKVLGHSNIETTAGYIHGQEETLGKEVKDVYYIVMEENK